MGEETKIQWCDHTFNAWIGCEKITEGCKNCYAAVGTSARVSASRGLPLWGPGSHRQITSADNWRKPIRWNKAAERDGVRRRVFCSSLSDVFEDRADLADARARLWLLVGMTPHLDWLLLTKRPENARRLWAAAARSVEGADPDQSYTIWQPNVWLGTTTENQQRYDERWPHLYSAGAAVTFISHEPALGPLTLTCYGCGHDVATHRAPDQGGCPAGFPSWVITGGESVGGRLYDAAWARSLIEQTRGVPIAMFVKQLGRSAVDSDSGTIGPLRLRDGKGGDWNEWPVDLRVREWPQ